MKKINIINLTYNLYIFIFIFTMINREFLFFGLDLRFILLVLGIGLIYIRLLNINRYGTKVKKDKNFNILAMFFLWCLLCNISWFWNGLDLNTEKFINQIILIINNFIALIVFYLYREYIKQDTVNKIIVFSCLVLMISFILISMGYQLSQISGSNVRAIAVASNAASDNKNIFGGNYRLAGYAEDPNYASMFWVIGIIATLNSKSIKKKLKLFLVLIFIICFGFSCSKTILLSFFLGIIYIVFVKILSKYGYRKIINGMLIILIILSCYILPKTQILSSMSTMKTRFNMWNMANELFERSPIIGNGIDSFKSYINKINNGNWYVQPHSTYWQLASETGIIGIVMFMSLVYSILTKSKNNYNNFLIFIYLFFAINFETIQLQFIIYILYIMNIEQGWEENEKQKNIISSKFIE